MNTTEYHPLEPFLPVDAKVLMLGSFPPPRQRWAMDFYYPNPQNDMWRVMGLVFFNDRDHFFIAGRPQKESISDFCRERAIALYDTARAVTRLNNDASDKFLQIIEPTDIGSLLERIPRCHTVAATGEKAAESLAAYFGVRSPAVGHSTCFEWAGRDIQLYRMPSTSRAYPLALDKKARAYALMFDKIGVL